MCQRRPGARVDGVQRGKPLEYIDRILVPMLVQELRILDLDGRVKWVQGHRALICTLGLVEEGRLEILWHYIQPARRETCKRQRIARIERIQYLCSLIFILYGDSQRRADRSLPCHPTYFGRCGQNKHDSVYTKRHESCHRYPWTRMRTRTLHVLRALHRTDCPAHRPAVSPVQGAKHVKSPR